MNKLTLENIQNHLDTLKKSNSELKNLFLYNKSALSKKIALAENLDGKGICTKTDFLTYSEMNSFLRGYSFKGNGTLY